VSQRRSEVACCCAVLERHDATHHDDIVIVLAVSGASLEAPRHIIIIDILILLSSLFYFRLPAYAIFRYYCVTLLSVRARARAYVCRLRSQHYLISSRDRIVVGLSLHTVAHFTPSAPTGTNHRRCVAFSSPFFFLSFRFAAFRLVSPRRSVPRYTVSRSCRKRIRVYVLIVVLAGTVRGFRPRRISLCRARGPRASRNTENGVSL